MRAKTMSRAAGLLMLCWLALGPANTLAGNANGSGPISSPVPLVVNIYNTVVDEQNTNTYYGATDKYCNGYPSQPTGDYAPALLTGDQQLTPFSPVYISSPWPVTITNDVATQYTDGLDCGPTCVSAEFNSSGQTLVLDTRGTKLNGNGTPRQSWLNLSQPCTTLTCPGLAPGNSTLTGQTVKEPMLMNIFLHKSDYGSLSTCSTVGCPEAKVGYASLWFTDPSDSSVTWRLVWSNLRILRMSQNTWYVLGDACDGTQLAGLSKLTGNRTLPHSTLNGYYLIPFFLQATIK